MSLVVRQKERVCTVFMKRLIRITLSLSKLINEQKSYAKPIYIAQAAAKCLILQAKLLTLNPTGGGEDCGDKG